MRHYQKPKMKSTEIWIEMIFPIKILICLRHRPLIKHILVDLTTNNPRRLKLTKHGQKGPRNATRSREAEKPRSPTQAEKPRSREVRHKPRSQEAEKPRSYRTSREAEKPRSREAEEPPGKPRSHRSRRASREAEKPPDKLRQ